MLPISVELENKPCTVIGGGKVALRRVKALLAEGAKVTVISPDLLSELALLVDGVQLKWHSRPFQDGDTIGAFLVIAATNLRAVNAQIGVECNRSQLINIVDDPTGSNFYFPAIGRKGLLTVAVSTEGASPLLAKKIRDDMMRSFDDDFEHFVYFVKEARERILALGLEGAQQKRLLKEIVNDCYLDRTLQQQFLRGLDTTAMMI